MIAASTLESTLHYARQNPEEQQGFQRFLDRLSTALRQRTIPCQGMLLTLSGYLDHCLQHGSPGGDEQPVVDPFMGQVLTALGYGPEEIAYNSRLAGLEERAVPDYTIRLPEYLGMTPVLVVEDKATAVRDLHRARRGAEGGASETPREQLRRYTLSGAVNGRAGLLCNGFRLEAWDFGPDGDVCLAEVDLHDVGRQLAADQALAPRHHDALRTLYGRFSRAAFAQAYGMLSGSRERLPLPREVLAQIQAALDRSGHAAAANNRGADAALAANNRGADAALAANNRGADAALAANNRGADAALAIGDIVLAHREALWQGSAIDVAKVPEQLVDALRGLIEHFASDVRQQLVDALQRYSEYEGLLRAEEEQARLDQRLKAIELYRHHFALREEEYFSLCLRPLMEWRRRPRMEILKHTVAEIWGSLSAEDLFRNREAPKGTQGGLLTSDYGEVLPAQGGSSPEQRRRRVLESLRQEIEQFCRAALTLYAEQERLSTSFRASIRAANAYGVWLPRVSSSVLVGASEDTLRAEFSRQTAYVFIIRLLLVRICEDKGIFKRKLSNGGLAQWQECAAQYLDYASGRSYEYLTRMAYECAQNVYIHFYGASALFDWYRIDDKMLLRALLVLNAFNLARIDTDIIGTVYGRYLTEGKHEQGRYFTPREVVRHMLDLAGYRVGETADRRLCDLCCGSGSFLVEAAQRLLHSYRGPDGTIPDEQLQVVVNELQRSLFGIDLNPFACYLAETNLLIQVLDLVRQAQRAGRHLSVERFQIYSEDSLRVDEAVADAPEAALVLLSEDQAVSGLLKARAGRFKDGFDVLVGNPPYVRADAKSPSYVQYRKELEKQAWFTTKKQKWDLYVPFVEQYRRLLSDRPDARACLITINSLATAPYAMELRRLLARDSLLHDIVFTEDLKLFEDASWQDNLIFAFSRQAPPPGHRTRRWRPDERSGDGALRCEVFDEIEQLTADPERLFHSRAAAPLDLQDTVRMDALCYVSKGMVLHAKETLQAGEIIEVPAAYDPQRFGEELVEDLGKKGKRVRHRPFTRDELVADQRDPVHPRRYLDPDQVLRGGIGATRWLEYGPHTRCPARVDRPTFPELYQHPKLLFGTFKGIAVDEGEGDDFYLTPDSLRIAVRWADLAAVENRSLEKKRAQLREAGRYDPALSRGFSLWYLCALALSEPLQRWLSANKRSMKEHVYPGDIEALPIKRRTLLQQRPFIELAQERHRLLQDLSALKREGYHLGSQISVPVRPLAQRFREEHPREPHSSLLNLGSKGLLRMEPAFLKRDLRRAKAVGGEIQVVREVAARVGASLKEPEQVARLLARYLAELPGVFADRQAVDLLPATEAGLLALAAYLDDAAAQALVRQARVQHINAQLDQLAWALYR